MQNLIEKPQKQNKGEKDVEEKKKRPTIKSATDLQRLKLEKLMKNPDKPIIIPETPKEKDYMQTVPSFVRNVMGSSAGAGSGEFHVYRHLRRKEYARQKCIHAKSTREQLDDDYQSKLEKNRLEAEAKTAKKRAKRLKKKQRAKKPKTPNNDELEKQDTTDDDDDDEDEDENSNLSEMKEHEETKKDVDSEGTRLVNDDDEICKDISGPPLKGEVHITSNTNESNQDKTSNTCLNDETSNNNKETDKIEIEKQKEMESENQTKTIEELSVEKDADKPGVKEQTTEKKL